MSLQETLLIKPPPLLVTSTQFCAESLQSRLFRVRAASAFLHSVLGPNPLRESTPAKVSQSSLPRSSVVTENTSLVSHICAVSPQEKFRLLDHSLPQSLSSSYLKLGLHLAAIALFRAPLHQNVTLSPCLTSICSLGPTLSSPPPALDMKRREISLLKRLETMVMAMAEVWRKRGMLESLRGRALIVR